jgi:hypothetical protein
MPVLNIFYVSSRSLHLLKFFMRSEILLLHLVSLACYTVNSIVLLAFHALCIGPAFLGFHVCMCSEHYC